MRQHLCSLFPVFDRLLVTAFREFATALWAGELPETLLRDKQGHTGAEGDLTPILQTPTDASLITFLFKHRLPIVNSSVVFGISSDSPLKRSKKLYHSKFNFRFSQFPIWILFKPSNISEFWFQSSLSKKKVTGHPKIWRLWYFYV